MTLRRNRKTNLRVLFAACGILLFSALCGAQSSCPWLNAATASGVLGGSATVEASSNTNDSGICLFRFRSDAQNDTLRIAVIKATKPENASKEMMPLESSCTSPGLPLKGLGNEAILCGSNVHKSSGELVVGRVRDQIFTVTINEGLEDASPVSKEVLEDNAQEIAKMVAGILF